MAQKAEASKKQREKAHCRKHIMCASFLFRCVLFLPNAIFLKNRVDLLVIRKFNLILKKLSIRTSMHDTFKQYQYLFQTVPKSRRYLKLSAPQRTASRSITTEIKLRCATCMQRTIQGSRFVQPREHTGGI